MRIFLLAILCAVALKAVVADNENEVKRGAFPFMAFLYYSDETIIDNGARFTRSAALIKNDWLISSSDVNVAFPQKTLLARLGAVAIDKKFTFNEDEDEQEREVILILRPKNYSATEWWKTDISLLKTLLPFNITMSVGPATLISSFDVILKNCYILVFDSRDNATERYLIQINVKLLPPVQEHCGNYFSNETMVCSESDESNALANTNFCKGNSGGPLLCDSDLIGLQTYVNECKQPHLYQLVLGWNRLITCAIEEQYLTQACADVCLAISKDPPSSVTPDVPKVSDLIGDVLGDKFTQSEVTEAVYIEINTVTPIALMLGESVAISEHYKEDFQNSEVTNTKIKEEQTEIITTTTTSVTTENLTHDTTSKSTESTKTEEVMMDPTAERDRKNRIEAKQQLVRSEASLNTPSIFHYLMTFVYVLAYT